MHYSYSCFQESYADKWKAQNKARYESIPMQVEEIKQRIQTLLVDICRAKKALMLLDLCIAQSSTRGKAVKLVAPILVVWQAPPQNYLKVNSDGAAKGNPGH